MSLLIEEQIKKFETRVKGKCITLFLIDWILRAGCWKRITAVNGQKMYFYINALEDRIIVHTLLAKYLNTSLQKITTKTTITKDKLLSELEELRSVN